jgi:hypothetical protein
MSLHDEIEDKRQSIHTDAYPMSIGELVNLYRDGELDIHPEFQRFYRWSEEQKSRLVESILLGIPIPSVFVSQREDGVWDVIDGLQRLSTIFQLMGLLRNEDNELVQPLTLRGTRYLPSLEGKTWNEGGESDVCLNRDQQLIIKRAKIHVNIVLKESGRDSKFELFQRLNTGGSPLSDQELRNCVLIMVNRTYYEWLGGLASNADFNACIALTDRALEEQYNVELIVRFLVFRTLPDSDLRNVGDLGEYLTDRIVEFARNEAYDREGEAKAFEFTFSRLAAALGDNAFRKYDATGRRFLGGFLISAFETMALGLGGNYERIVGGAEVPDLLSIAKKPWQDEESRRGIGSGVRASTRIPVTIGLGRRLFAQL